MAGETLCTYLVEPIDPMVFGDGRSIGTVGVARSRVLPPPTQLAGAVRGQAGEQKGGPWNAALRNEVLEFQVLGPLGVLLAADGRVEDWWLPRPADAIVMEALDTEPAREPDRVPCPADDTAMTQQPIGLVPLGLPVGCQWGEASPGVGMPEANHGKPDKGATEFWSWKFGLRPWLCGEAVDKKLCQVRGPVPELRTHVALSTNGTAIPGALFGVTGIRYRTNKGRHAMAFRSDAALTQPLVRPLGGERRLAHWRKEDVAWPEVPPRIRQSAKDGFVRLYLATPGAFEAGHRPELMPHAEVVAQASGRPLVVSGWDLARREPKPSRRLLPAGSVLFLKLLGSPESNLAWVERTWLTSISTALQDRRDGLGLALFGTWDGKIAEPNLPGDQP